MEGREVLGEPGRELGGRSVGMCIDRVGVGGAVVGARDEVRRVGGED